MDLTPENVRQLRSDLSKVFRTAYDEAPIWYNQVGSTVSSRAHQNVYAWANQMPSLRKWVGPRVVQNLASSSYTLVNETYEVTIGVKREDFEDDNLGIYEMDASGAGAGAAKHPDELFTALLKDGESRECFDAQNFFDTDHPVNPYDASYSTYSNYSASGKALTRANYIIIRAAMMAYVGEKGRNLGIVPNLLVVPPALETMARSIVEAGLINDGNNAAITNTLAGTAKVLVVNELSGEDTAWYLLDTRKPIKPFVYQLRRKLYLTMKAGADDHVVLEDNMVKLYGDCRDTAGYSLPFLAYKAVA